MQSKKAKVRSCEGKSAKLQRRRSDSRSFVFATSHIRRRISAIKEYIYISLGYFYECPIHLDILSLVTVFKNFIYFTTIPFCYFFQNCKHHLNPKIKKWIHMYLRLILKVTCIRLSAPPPPKKI